MKKLAISIPALLLFYPAVSWLMGFAIENRVDSLADQAAIMVPQLRLIEKSNHGVVTSDSETKYELGSTLKVNLHYHRGYFVSVDDATVEVSAALLDALPAFKTAVSATVSADSGHTPLRFFLRTVIHHGPICGWTCFALAGADAHVKFTGALQAALTRVFGDREPITIRSRFSFFGGGSSRISSPPFELAPIGQSGRLDWGGIDTLMHYGARQDWYDVIATAPSLHIDGAKGILEVSDMSLNAQAKRLLRTLYEGDSRLELKRISVTGADKVQQFALNDLLLVNQSHAQNHFMDLSYRLGAGAIVTQPLTLSNAHVDVTWKHLDVESLESLTTAMRAAGQQADASAAPAARAQAMMAAVKQPLQTLLLEEPEMDVDRLRVSCAQGQGSMTGVIRLVGINAADIEAPAALLRKLDVRLDIAIDEAFLANLPGPGANTSTQLQPMIDQGYITRAHGTLRSQVLFAAGQLTLNGKPFNPAAPRPAASPPLGTVH
jgi:uncharacterized protein YdgA (DUF945 family)